MHTKALQCLAGLLLAVTATAAPFTLENALAENRAAFPQMARVSEETTSGILAYPNLTYATVPDGPLRLDLFRPPGEQEVPLVLLIHGGGWDSGDRSMEHPFARALADRGYATATVSYRLGPAGRFPAALHDLKAAVRWLRQHAAAWHLDPRRIAVIGGSAGGQLAALLGATNGDASLEGNVGTREGSSEVQAVVDIDGLADFTDPRLVAQQHERPSAPTRFLGGSYAERPGVWREASPLFHVGPKSAPTLFLCSTAATPYLPGREKMQQALQAFHIATETVVIPDTPHVFWLFEPWFPKVVNECDRFLRKTVTTTSQAPQPTPEVR